MPDFGSALISPVVNLTGISNPILRDSIKASTELIGSNPFSGRWQACEIYVTKNTTGIKLSHKLGSVPLDVILTRLIAPSATQLKFKYSEFTRDEVVFDVSGLGTDETLNARFLVGSLSDLVNFGTVKRVDGECQAVKGKF